jgi:hypothetical protein
MSAAPSYQSLCTQSSQGFTGWDPAEDVLHLLFCSQHWIGEGRVDSAWQQQVNLHRMGTLGRLRHVLPCVKLVRVELEGKTHTSNSGKGTNTYLASVD